MNGICSACKESCEVIIVDTGICQYEYWGYKGRQVELEALSTCCDAPAFWNDVEDFITAEDVRREEYDRFYG